MNIDIKNLLNSIEVDRSLCEYWDVRVEDVNKTEITYEDFNLVACSIKPSLGAFIRVYIEGFWYYSATTDLASLSRQIVDLCALAKNFHIENANKQIQPYNTGSYQADKIQFSATRVDKVPVKLKKEICESYFEVLRSYRELKKAKVFYVDEYKIKHFRSSTEVAYSYDFNQCGIALVYTAADNSGTFDDKISLYSSKVEDLKAKSDFIKAKIEESHLFINAATIKAGKYPVVMDSEVVGVFAHESFGHKSEADFMIGDKGGKEAWGIGKKVGNKCLSIVDCGNEIASSGYCPFDDEGFPAQKTYLIKNGLLVGRLHSQQTAQFFEEAPTGNGRSISFEFEPIVRMTNTYVEPGENTVEELISKVRLGIFARDVNHGSGLSTFTIAPRKCYMIRNGKVAEPIRVSVISGSVFEALENVVACSKSVVIESSVFGGCGKMEQWPLSVAFGGPIVLVNDLMVS